MTEIQFMTSAAGPEGFPASDCPEIAIAGRSNSGKSSFLNQLTRARKNTAKVSQAPGKTRLLNFFNVGEFAKGAKSPTWKYRWVDMPGYGFASRSGDEVNSWTELIEGYLSDRPNLVGAVLIIDIRRDWIEDEENLRAFFNSLNIPFCLALTKKDKMTEAQVRNRIKYFEKVSGVKAFAVSNLKNTGGEDVDNYCYKQWVRTWTPVAEMERAQ